MCGLTNTSGCQFAITMRGPVNVRTWSQPAFMADSVGSVHTRAPPLLAPSGSGGTCHGGGELKDIGFQVSCCSQGRCG
jgi:hypothetical protein